MTTKKFKRVVLHFGGDKTGSTSIQGALDSSRSVLLETGIVAYAPGHWHAELGSYFCHSPQNFIYNKQSEIVNISYIKSRDEQYFSNLIHWLNTVPPCENLVFSYEGFVDLDIDALNSFNQFCLNWALDILLVIYVRPPLSYATSAMSQRVKQGKYAYLCEDPPVSHYKEFIKKIDSIFPRNQLLVKKFDKNSLVNGDVVEDFCQILSVAGDVLSSVLSNSKSANEGISKFGLILGEKVIDNLNASLVHLNETKYYESVGDFLSIIPGPKIDLTDDQISTVITASKDNTDFLKSEFELDLHEDSDIYKNTLYVEDSECRNLIDAFASVLAKVVIGQKRPRSNLISSEFRLINFGIVGNNTVTKGDIICFELEFGICLNIEEIEIGIHIFDQDFRWAFGTNTTLLNKKIIDVKRGTYIFQYLLAVDLPEGSYTAGFAVAEPKLSGIREIAWFDKMVDFTVNLSRPCACIGYCSMPVDFCFVKTSDSIKGLIEDFSGSVEIKTSLTHVSVNEVFKIFCILKNTSNQLWVGLSTTPILLSYHWFNMAGDVIVFDGIRTAIPGSELQSGQIVTVEMTVVAPSSAGLFRLIVSPLQEGVCWFDVCGFTPCELNISVLSQD